MKNERVISMTAWTSDELNKIGASEELQIAPLRLDSTPRMPVTIWVIRYEDDLYVRSYKGRDSFWFRAVQARHEGHIQSGGVDKNVVFVEETDPAINDQIDAAYRTKYHQYPQHVLPMVTSDARATTLKLIPRS
jgi:hypothetical protein